MISGGLGGRAVGSHEALLEIYQQPFGKWFLGLAALGLLGYSLWRFVEAWHPRNKKWAKRMASLVSGMVYLSLFTWTAKFLIGISDKHESEREMTASLLAVPAGRWLVGAIGVGFVIAALFQVWNAYGGKFMKTLDCGKLSRLKCHWVEVVGKVGCAARGLVFALMGWFLIKCAIAFSSREARGLGGALVHLLRQPFGQVLLASTAVGLLAYALHCGIQARYRRLL